MEDLASRLANRDQLSTDGHNAYLSAVENAFGWNGVDYAMLRKLYAQPDAALEAAKRYSWRKCLRCLIERGLLGLTTAASWLARGCLCSGFDSREIPRAPAL